MGLFDIFRKKEKQTPETGVTLAELVERLKTEGYTESDIRDQLVRSFGKERLKTFGEGATVSSEKADEVARDLKDRSRGDQ